MSQEHDICKAVTTTGLFPSSGAAVGDYTGRDEAMIQVDVVLGGGTISYTVEGKIGPTYAWQTIGSAYTASTIFPIAKLPYLRLNVSAITGGAAIARAGVLQR